MIGYLIFLFIFIIFYIKYVPKKLQTLFLTQLTILLVLLIVSNILSSHYSGRNYPAIFDDGIKYHIIGQIWAENVGFVPRVSDIGIIAEKWPVYIDQLGWEVMTNPFSFLAPGWTLLIVGNIYNLFGVNPVFIKLINILFLQISALLFFRIIYKPNADWKIFLKLFMFFPILMFYSVTFLKESFILLLILLFVYSVKVHKSNIILILCLVLLFITRPPALFIIGLGYFISLINFKNVKPLLIGSLFSFLMMMILWNINIGGFGLKYVMTDMYFGLTPRGSEELRFANGLHFFQFILSNPLMIMKPILFGFIDVVMNPNPWNFVYITDPYTTVGFSYYWEQIGNYLSSFYWYFFLLILFPAVAILKGQKKLLIELKRNKFYIFIYLTNLFYMGFRADLRYKFVFMPILMILGYEIITQTKMLKNVRLNYILLFIILAISLAIFDTFFWGRTTISIV